MLSTVALAFVALSTATVSVLCQTAAQAWTPRFGACPSNFSLVRMTGASGVNQSLSTGEAQYVSSRRANVLPGAFKSYLSSVQGTNVALPDYVSSILGGTNGNLPTVGIAISGETSGAAMFGAGVINALDGRNASAVKIGTGGLLQAATYISGLSGGSWIVYSLSQANFPTVQNLIFGPPYGTATPGGYGGWITDYVTLGVDNVGETTALYSAQLATEIGGKYEAGFPVTLGRRFGSRSCETFLERDHLDELLRQYHFKPCSTFTSYEQPFPIVVVDSWSPGPGIAGSYIPAANVIYEFNAYEMGSYDPTLAAFTPIEYLGTTNTSICVTGFEQADFVLGASSNIFVIYNSSASNLMNSPAWPWIEIANISYPQPGVTMDVALYPNPFYGLNHGTFVDAEEKYLSLVYGGEDGEAVPVQPLLVKARDVDLIVAVDGSADNTQLWTEGSSMVNAQIRAEIYSSAYSFPAVPTSTTQFIAQNLTLHPTFFGCDNTSSPLLVYIAKGGPPLGQTAYINNTGDTFEEPFAQAVLAQAFDIATQGIPSDYTKDPEYPACLACAVVDRVRAREGIERSGVCSSCFAKYCWNGTQVAVSTTSGAVGTSLTLSSMIAGVFALLLALGMVAV
ncbi:hypothetical protein JAAARDRAFT_201409 [Jaapia argillacea MUCL 33604]|uniref:Lysophospholipase n=1 Tax=Jaapia argillacea MUCL 33604 TaxID=933084 RepID=A0A067QMV7_9AGAM|nr:hypothetical protein JAAARDRAFT_201409 [Jaapia argillacea MUCL 33604]